MSDPNTVLSAWQMTIMAVVPLLALFGWLIAIFIAARGPRQRAAATSLAGATGGGTGTASHGTVTEAAVATAADQGDPTPAPSRRLAA
jgi:hypothetical protein